MSEKSLLWELSESVEAPVSRSFAWAFWTNVRNWSDPPATFALDGPFAEGARGTTLMPGEPPRNWTVGDVSPPEQARIEMPLGGAALGFAWRFEGLGEVRTRITQTVTLWGSAEDRALSEAKEIFRANLPAAMRRIAEAMATAFTASR